MTPKITQEAIQDSFQLESLLRDIVKSFQPSYIPGNVYVVMNSTDEAYVQYYKDYNKIYNDGSQMIHTSLSSAYGATVSNRNDVVLLNAHGGHALTSMLSVTKNRVHFYGMGSLGRLFGQRARITLGVSTTTSDIAAVQTTGVGTTFKNLKIQSAGTATAERYAFADGGEYTNVSNVELYKSTQLDDTLAAELLLNGDSSVYKDCTFGSNVNAISGAIIRPCIQLKREVIAGKVARDCYFENCLFWRKAGNVANAYVDAPGTTDVERMLMFKNCEFFNTELAAAIPAEAVTCSGGKQTEGLIALKNCSAWNTTLLKEASVGIWVDGAVPTHNTTGVAVEA